MSYISIAGEGAVDLAMGRRLLNGTGHQVAGQFDKRGKDNLDRNLEGYCNASRVGYWLVLRDLDQEDCPVNLMNRIAPKRHDFPNFMLRICVRSVEAWVLADRAGFAQHFGVRAAIISQFPDSLANPKAALMEIVSSSRYRTLRSQIIPRPGSGRRIGPEYNAVLIDFVERIWTPERARLSSPSLMRALQRLEALT